MSSRQKASPTSSARRSNMRAIKSRGNRSTELRFRALLTRFGLRGWRMHPTEVAGVPDFYFSRLCLAVFVDGCFWHSCPKCGHLPKANRAYWSEKLARNKRRDTLKRRLLRSQGIAVVALWECELRDRPKSCLTRVLRALDRLAEPTS
jgi:DNA mismatch endonuclease (patch repair protein)